MRAALPNQTKFQLVKVAVALLFAATTVEMNSQPFMKELYVRSDCRSGGVGGLDCQVRNPTRPRSI